MLTNITNNESILIKYEKMSFSNFKEGKLGPMIFQCQI